MGNHPIDGMLGTTMEKIKEMVDVDSVIGKPITTPDGTTVIPDSKVNRKLMQNLFNNLITTLGKCAPPIT